MVISNFDELGNADFSGGVTMLVDKPENWTSFDVVNKIRFSLKKLTGIKKIKVGHAGTLDPLATGLLIVAAGKDTKQIDNFQELNKVYSGTIYLGATTPSFDREFEPDQTYPVSHIDIRSIREACKKLTGEIIQIPPAYSAVSINGERAYKKARKGEEFTLRERKVNIYQFTVDDFKLPLLKFRVECQKGTYIRSLASDLGKELGSGAYLFDLRREKIGNHNVDNAFQLEELIFFLENIQKN
ncbi:MAG: tRNA pseudouridine(55) synthase TruB [Deltaproteobacteria bacterium]